MNTPAIIALPGQPACPVHHGTALPCPHCPPSPTLRTGAPALWELPNLPAVAGVDGVPIRVPVRILESRSNFGRVDFLITPDGAGGMDTGR